MNEGGKVLPKKKEYVVTTDCLADPPKNTVNDAEETDRTQRDRCIEVYHETMRQRNNKTKVKS